MHADMTFAVSLILLLFLLAMILAAFLISFLPKESPYQQMLAPLTRRLAASVGLIIMAAPAQYLTAYGWLYDLAALAGALWYWWQFFDRFLLADRASPQQGQGPVTGGAAAAQTASDTGLSY